MNEITVTFIPTMRDYHIAVYYAAVNRYKMGFRMFVLSGLIFAACQLSAYFGLMPQLSFVGYIFMGFLVWAILILAQLESGILKYSKSGDALIGHKMTLSFTHEKLKISTPYNGKSDVLKLDSLFCAIEISSMFLLYINGTQSIMLPHHATTAEQRSQIRSILRDNLHDRLYTRNDYNSMLPRRSPLRK